MSKAHVISSINRAAQVVAKHLPDICVALGIVAGAATVVEAVKATGDANDILDDAKRELDEIKASESAQDENQGKAIFKVYARTIARLFRVYIKAILCGGLSIALILYSHGALKARNAQLLAAANMYESMFTNLYHNVADKYGEEVANELRYGLEKSRTEISVVDPETGEVKTKKIKDTVLQEGKSIGEISEYARIFDNLNANYSRHPGDNQLFLKRIQAFANDKLNLRGHLFLNEVYDMCGWDRTEAGQVIGWYKDGPNGYVNFDLHDIYDLNNHAFIDGLEKSVIVDFNVDGVIIDKLGLAHA